MEQVSLKKGIETLYPNATEIRVKRNHTTISGFFTVGEQVFYISQELGQNYVKNLDKSGIMYRKAKDYRDYTGEQNIWDFSKRLEQYGLKVKG